MMLVRGVLRIVGDVGDQLGLEALALDALVHGISDGGAQIVELPGVPGQVTVHFVGVDLEVRVAPTMRPVPSRTRFHWMVQRQRQ